MSNSSTKKNWTLYGIGMILLGLLPFARTFIPFWLSKLSDAFVFTRYGFYIGTMHINTDEFWFVYMFLMSAVFVIYGVVCMVQARGRSLQIHTLRQSISRKTVTLAALFGITIGVALIGTLVGAWLLSVVYCFIEVWEDRYGYVNALVEWIQK